MFAWFARNLIKTTSFEAYNMKKKFEEFYVFILEMVLDNKKFKNLKIVIL
jgi:hypothetical protein